jgi:hypothetical protein
MMEAFEALRARSRFALESEMERRINQINAVLAADDPLTVDELRDWASRNEQRAMWMADLTYDFAAVGLDKADALLAARTVLIRYGEPPPR